MSVKFDATVIGCGTIGAAIGAALASRGLNVVLYDSDPLRRNSLANDTSTFSETDMAHAMLCAATAKRLHVVDRLERQLFPANYIVCTPTPLNKAEEFDDSALDRAMDAIIDVAQSGDAVFIRCTVPIGTTRRLAARMKTLGLDLQFACTPDRSIEGRTFADQFSVPQLVGGVDEQAGARAASLFAPLSRVIDVGCAEAAEAAKLFANTWRASIFATSNAMAMACKSFGLDVHLIFAAASENYPRFSPPRPGPVGGPCLLKDVKLLAASIPPPARSLLRSVSESEARFIALIAAALDAHLAAQPEPLRIALVGIAFKGRPAIDNARDSVALALARHLRARWSDAVLVGWDAVMTADQIEKTGLVPTARFWDAVEDSSLVLYCNDHPTLAQFDLEKIAQATATGALIYDLSGVTAPFRPALPNAVRHHILGRGEIRKGSA